MIIVHWLSKFPLSHFFWTFCVGFKVNLRLNLLYISTWLKEFPPFPNIMYVYVVHALRACHCKSKADLYNSFLLNSKLNSLSVMYIQIIKFDSWVPYARI